MRCLFLLALLASLLPCPAGAERVERVIDGDTIVVEGMGRVRYIGMDTPEADQPYAEDATEENRRLVEGRDVRLEYDVERHDPYARTLAYVHVDGVMANAELLRRGCAQVMTIPPNVRYADLFLRLEREARDAKRGLWGRPDPTEEWQVTLRLLLLAGFFILIAALLFRRRPPADPPESIRKVATDVRRAERDTKRTLRGKGKGK